MHTYQDIPLEQSAFGEELYESGRALVAAGVTPDRVMWDADDVLWDWMMGMVNLTPRLPRLILFKNMQHREYLVRKAGVFELLWGMRHAALERHLDPLIRIWTDGYPWRLWRLSEHIPGFATLLGVDAKDPKSFADSLNIFCRPDYVRALRVVWHQEHRDAWLSTLPELVRATVLEQFVVDPFDTSFKLPDLATLIGKSGFSRVDFLVDDAEKNMRRFIASGRSGVHVISKAPRVLFSRVPNTAWFRPNRSLVKRQSTVMRKVASALLELAQKPLGFSQSVDALDPPVGVVPQTFFIDVPNVRITREWIEPMRALKSELGMS